jgi:hypothetical protein
MEQQDGFAPSTPWDHRGDLVWMPRKRDTASGRHSRRRTRAMAAACLEPRSLRASMTSEANVAVALPHDVELQIEEAG